MYLSTVKIKGLEHPVVVCVNDDKLMKRPLYERILYGWSNDYISKYIEIKELKFKHSKCESLV